MELRENLVELRKINLTYNKGKNNAFQSLFDVDVNIKAGEFVVILGPSGCGKSSLLNVIAGLENPDSGTVFINEVDVLKMKPIERTEFHRNKIGMIFQSYNLIPTLSVLDNVALPQIFVNVKRKERNEKVMVMLERFGIKEQWKKIPSELSGGEQQRIGIARAIINDPWLLLADEAVGNLDSKSANNVMQIMSELNKNEGKTILFVTHASELVSWGTHIIYMKDGKIEKEEWKDVQGFSKEVVSKEEENKSKFDKIMEKLRGLSQEQINLLLEPIKAKIIAESFLIPYEDQQIRMIEETIRLRLSGVYDTAKLFEQLDKSIEKGGVGLDERIAKNFSFELEDLILTARKIFEDLPGREKADCVVKYLMKNKEINIKVEHIEKVTALIQQRITNEISYGNFREALDLSEVAGGAGLDKRTVRKILREVDLVLIIGFGF